MWTRKPIGTGSAALVIALFMIWAAPALAERSSKGRRSKAVPHALKYTGSYRYAEDLDHGRELVNTAVNEAISQVTPILRPSFRKIAAKRDYLVKSIRISVNTEKIGFRVVAYRSFGVTTQPGIPHIITSKKGSITKVLQRFRGEQFEQIIENDSGEMHNVFTLLDDGETLRVDTTITSKLLKRPVSVQLDYKRVTPPARPQRRRQRRRRRVQPRRPRPPPTRGRLHPASKLKGSQQVVRDRAAPVANEATSE